jgi:hypothetical protein
VDKRSLSPSFPKLSWNRSLLANHRTAFIVLTCGSEAYLPDSGPQPRPLRASMNVRSGITEWVV